MIARAAGGARKAILWEAPHGTDVFTLKLRADFIIVERTVHVACEDFLHGGFMALAKPALVLRVFKFHSAPADTPDEAGVPFLERVLEVCTRVKP